MSVRLSELSLPQLLQAPVDLGGFHEAGFVTDEEVAGAIYEAAMGQ